jgi:four helix bundle protein
MELPFRFQGFEIWQRSAAITTPLFKVAAKFENRKRSRRAEQLRAAGLSIINNIVEGSGNHS